MHYLSKSKTSKQEKMFTNLSFCQKLIFWHKTSSCKCSMCLYYVGKVSNSFSKSPGTGWFLRACTTWALTKPLLRSKVLKNGSVQNTVILSKSIFMASNFFGGARWLSGRVSDSRARGRGFETYRRRVVSLSKTLYSPKVLVNYSGSGGSVPTWLKNCWLGR